MIRELLDRSLSRVIQKGPTAFMLKALGGLLLVAALFVLLVLAAYAAE